MKSLYNKTSREYLILISPPEEIREKVKRIKELFREKFRISNPLESSAHIVVMNINMIKDNENKLRHILENFCKDQEIFDVSLSGYDGFRPHTIYIKVIEKKIITALHRRLKEAVLSWIDIEDWQISTYSNPHLTVAMNLNEDVYNKAIGEYRRRKTELNFKADNLTLLWREHESSNKNLKWEGKDVFKFGQEQERLFG